MTNVLPDRRPFATVCRVHFPGYFMPIIIDTDTGSAIVNPHQGDETPLRECLQCQALEIMES